jgi:hypothetical protein
MQLALRQQYESDDRTSCFVCVFAAVFPDVINARTVPDLLFFSIKAVYRMTLRHVT